MESLPRSRRGQQNACFRFTKSLVRLRNPSPELARVCVAPSHRVCIQLREQRQAENNNKTPTLPFHTSSVQRGRGCANRIERGILRGETKCQRSEMFPAAFFCIVRTASRRQGADEHVVICVRPCGDLASSRHPKESCERSN